MLWDQISVTRKKLQKNTNTRRLNNTFLSNQQVPEEIKKEIKNFLKQMTMKTLQLNTYGMQQKQYATKLRKHLSYKSKPAEFI